MWVDETYASAPKVLVNTTKFDLQVANNAWCTKPNFPPPL
jgi:hypothetical protein